MYFSKSISTHPRVIHQAIDTWSPTRKMMFMALMAALAAILQAAGGLLPGIGYFFSPLATLPILLGALLSFRSGILTYLLTIFLLFLLEPSELLIFPFTTGLLGLGLGWTLRFLNRRYGILLANGLLLFTGICIPLYGFGFPIFGPAVSSSFIMPLSIMIFVFSLFYSWLWLELGLFFLRKLQNFLGSKSY